MKVKNRFERGKPFIIHDQFLMDLYKLNIAIPRMTIKERTINDTKYLVNMSNTMDRYGYEVGLMVKVPKELVEVGVDIGRFSYSIDDEYSDIYSEMVKRLTFSPVEILITNILFSHYLTEGFEVNQMSFKNIDRYRSKSTSYRNIVLNVDTAERYQETLLSLSKKIIYLKTNETCRAPKFGVNNREIRQPLVTFSNWAVVGTNDKRFDYSFGNYGKFITRSRRYSNMLPADCYSYNFKQANKHCVAMYLAQSLFSQKYRYLCGKQRKDCDDWDCEINIYNICTWIYGSYDITSDKYNNIKKYIRSIMEDLKLNKEIFEYVIVDNVKRHRGMSYSKRVDTCMTILAKLGLDGQEDALKLMQYIILSKEEDWAVKLPMTIDSTILVNYWEHKVKPDIA